MDLSTTPRRITEGVADLQKTRVAKSVFSIRSLVDVGDTDLSEVEDNEKIQSEFLPFHATVSIFSSSSPYPFPFVTFHERLVDELYYTIAYVRSHSRIIHTSIRYGT